MMDLAIFYIKDNHIKLNKYRLILRRYHSLQKDKYVDDIMYLDDDGLYEWEVNRVPKHKLMEIVSKEEIDISAYGWMDGIELKTGNRAKEIAEIASYGSKEAYEASLPETQDAFNMDIDYRLSKLELGI